MKRIVLFLLLVAFAVRDVYGSFVDDHDALNPTFNEEEVRLYKKNTAAYLLMHWRFTRER